MTRICCVLLGVCALALTACGGSSKEEKQKSGGSASQTASGGGGKSGDGNAKPCSLVTSADAAKVLGEQVGAGATVDTPPAHSCTYKGAKATVFVQVTAPADSKAFARMKAGYLEPKPVSGLGDEAFSDAAAGSAPALAVRKGDTVVNIHSLLGAAGEKANRELMQTALGRL